MTALLKFVVGIDSARGQISLSPIDMPAATNSSTALLCCLWRRDLYWCNWPHRLHIKNLLVAKMCCLVTNYHLLKVHTALPDWIWKISKEMCWRRG